MDRTCSVDDCAASVRARGLCGRHWTVWRTHGDPAYVKPPRTCSVDACDRPHYGRGWCASHWQQLRDAPACSLDDCERPVRGRRLCSLHYDRQRRHGDPLYVAPERFCSVDDCDRPVSAHGFCSMHAKRVRKTGDPNRKVGGRGRPNRYETRADGVPVLVMTRPDGTELRSPYSPEDEALVRAHRWHVNSQGYVVYQVKQGDRVQVYRLARLILGLGVGDPRRPDHISGDRANNQRSNLRITSHQRNVAHQAIENRRGTSRFRNVYRSGRSGRWVAAVKVDYQRVPVGTFDTEEAAAAAVAAFRRQHGLPSGY